MERVKGQIALDYIDEVVFEVTVLGKERPLRECKCCQRSSRTVTDVPKMTKYPWDGKGKDPNSDVALCPECAEEHVAQMTDQWSEYYSGLL